MKSLLKNLLLLFVIPCVFCLLLIGCTNDTAEIFDETLHIHSYGEWTTTKEATCAYQGEMQRTCECGTVDTKAIEVLPHTVCVDQRVEATVDSTGLTEGSHCSVCGAVITAQEVIEKLNPEIEVISNLRYEGATDGKLKFYWDISEEISNSVSGITVTVDNGKEKVSNTVSPTADNWEYTVSGEQSKYTFTFTPDLSIDGNIKSASCDFYWMPEVLELDFPRVEITTENGVLPSYTKISAPAGAVGSSITNAEYVQSILTIYDKENKELYRSSDSSFDKAKIKVRGNTSAYSAKQPFKIKLDKKADLLKGLVQRDENADYKNKNWVLLKSGETLNTAVGNTVASIVGMDWTPSYSYVTLFVNGDFRGLYILSESVEQDEERCDVSDDGYIIEKDAYWWNEDMYFTTPLSENSDLKYTFKHPDPEDFDETSEEYLYIKQYITELENAIVSGENLSEYMDIQSFARWLLVHDIIATYDNAGSNIFMTKYDNTDASVLKMGPVWDFDSMYFHSHPGDAKNIDKYANIRNTSRFYMNYLIENEEFMAVYKEEYARIADQVIDAIEETLEIYCNDTVKELWAYEYSRWGQNWGDRNIYNYCNYVVTWFEAHMAWLDTQIATS